ncbi:hypothetical protein GP486_003509 [Trichoglossum hirsutum]|uniref:BRCT domain-containing protein n=1 Tax=Trichoglossum hirsutum TaxID=265104 RepID=A0A9P8LCS5_9PEZI|nr:hypothetical protein GP486_003509 [Trichoglossum hirsutum]
MGAVNQLDLTSDVTHLVVGELSTPKYRYVAKERPDVKVLDRDWIEAVRQSWIQGGETDVSMLEEKHRFPVFSGLKICFTGIEDVEERQKLQELVIANGAEYRADLTKQVTHLMAKKPEGKKYHYATLWGLSIVTTEWLRDSLERGMTLDENEYSHSIPLEERGKNAWIRRTTSGTCLGKRSRGDGEDDAILDGQFGGRRKLRRTTSQKLGSQNVRIWDDIIGGGFEGKGQQKNECGEDPSNLVHYGRSTVVGESNRGPQYGTVEVTGAPDEERDSGKYEAQVPKRSLAKLKGKGGLFCGRKFVLYGFDRRKVRFTDLRETPDSTETDVLYCARRLF